MDGYLFVEIFECQFRYVFSCMFFEGSDSPLNFYDMLLGRYIVNLHKVIFIYHLFKLHIHSNNTDNKNSSGI